MIGIFLADRRASDGIEVWAFWFKTMGDFAMGMEGWGMADYRPFWTNKRS